VVVLGSMWLTFAGACSSEPPPRQSADILAEVLAEAGERNAESPVVSPSLSMLPATFIGVLPCPDCPGIRLHLNLFENRSFRLRTAYLGQSEPPVDDIGTWTLGSDRRTLTVRGRRQSVLQFVIKDGRRLRQLDTTGREIGDDDAHDLVRADAYQPFEPRVQLQGLFVYMADAGLFTECLTKQRWPVATESANPLLERAYLEARPSPGAEVLVEIEGRVSMRPPMEGGGLRETLVVDRVIGAWPNRTCGMRVAMATINNTAWKLTHLGRQLVDTSELPLEPFLELRTGRAEFSASDGCNRVVGSYEQDGTRLTFSIGAVTRIGCPDGNQVSRDFSDALAATRSWNVGDAELELLDERGRVVARFVPQR
jgi:copper homeostasis protein (lipoprotein)